MKNFLSLAFTASLFAGIFACNQADKQSDAMKDVITHDTINPADAMAAIQRWENMRPYIDTALTNGHFNHTSNEIPRGFQVPFDDISGLLQIAKAGNKNSIYGVLAIQYDSTQTPPMPEITLIFQVKDATGKIHYYDFTKPCPTNCDEIR